MIAKAVIDDWLLIPKSIIRPMAWTKKLNGAEPCWLMFESAIEVSNELNQRGAITPEGLRIICQWRAGIGEAPAIYVFGLFLGSDRIYAIDVNRIGYHTNGNAGKGRPLYGRKIGGVRAYLVR